MTEEIESVIDNSQTGFLFKTIEKWGPDLLALAIRVVIAAIVLAVGLKVIGAIKHLAAKSMERAQVELTLKRFLEALIQAVLTGLLIFVVAGEIGLDSASIVALLGSAGLAFGLAAQGSLENFAGGVLILFMKPFKAEDYIITANGEGKVFAIGLVYTTLLTVDNKKIVIPNGSLANSPVTNLTAAEKRRLDILVGIGYDEDMKRARDVLEETFKACPLIRKDDAVRAVVDSLGESAVVLKVWGWVDTGDYWDAKWELTEAVKNALDREGIEIAYNYLNVVVQDKQAAGQQEPRKL